MLFGIKTLVNLRGCEIMSTLHEVDGSTFCPLPAWCIEGLPPTRAGPAPIIWNVGATYWLERSFVNPEKFSSGREQAESIASRPWSD